MSEQTGTELRGTVDARSAPTRSSEAPGDDAPPEAVLPPTRIRMTSEAIAAVRDMFEEEGLPEEGGLRLTAGTGAGCSAPLQYGMVLEPEPDDNDRVLEFGGVRLFLDPESAWVLDGLIVDYVTSSPMGEGFAFRHGKACDGPSC